MAMQIKEYVGFFDDKKKKAEGKDNKSKAKKPASNKSKSTK